MASMPRLLYFLVLLPMDLKCPAPIESNSCILALVCEI